MSSRTRLLFASTAVVLTGTVLSVGTIHLSEEELVQPRPVQRSASTSFDERLPALGARLPEFPAGSEKALADQACLMCHSVDIVMQQQMTRQQWSASVTKMINWGAPVAEEKRESFVEYLVKHFGPDNKRFKPVMTRPVGR